MTPKQLDALKIVLGAGMAMCDEFGRRELKADGLTGYWLSRHDDLDKAIKILIPLAK